MGLYFDGFGLRVEGVGILRVGLGRSPVRVDRTVQDAPADAPTDVPNTQSLGFIGGRRGLLYVTLPVMEYTAVDRR